MNNDPSDSEYFEPRPHFAGTDSAGTSDQIRTDLEVVRDDLVLVEPRRKPHPNFWWALLWCLLFLLVTQVTGAVVAVGVLVISNSGIGVALSRESMLESREMSMALMYGFGCAEVLAIAIPLGLILLFMGRDWYRQIALRLPSMTHLILALLILPSMIILSNGAYEIIRRVVPDVFGSMGMGNMESALDLFTHWPLPVAVAIIGLGPGIGEELFCRAFLGRGLVGHYGYVAGLLLTSILFGLLHVEPRQALVVIPMGMVLHFTYLTTRSLMVPMLLHFLNNSFAVLASRAAVPESMDDATTISPAIYLTAAAVLALLAWTLYRCRARLELSPDEPYPWVPSHPGIETPPAWSFATITHPWPNWLEITLIAVTFAGLITQIVLA